MALFQASTKSAGLYRASPLTTFTYGFGDDEEEKSRESSPSPSRTQQSSPKADTFSKRVGTQTPADILRATSAAPKTKKRSNSLVSTGRVSRPESDSHQTLPGVSACRITEKKFYTTPSPSSSSEYREQEQRVPSPKVRRSNNKSQMVTQSAILHANLQQQQPLNQTTPTIIDITKVEKTKFPLFVH